jgi:hypothetical protein
LPALQRLLRFVAFVVPIKTPVFVNAPKVRTRRI